LRILIAGDSLGLPRPHRMNNYNPKEKELAVHYENTYGYILEKKLRGAYPENNVHVINRSQRFLTIKNIFNQIVDHAYFFEPDVLILHVGIVDCWFRNELNGGQMTPINDFKKYLLEIVKVIRNRPNTKMVIIGISPTSLKMDNRYHGQNKEIHKYNMVFKDFVDYQQIFYIDMEKQIDINNIHEYLLPDDHHLNIIGNKLVANLLEKLLSAFIENEMGTLLFNESQDLQRAIDYFRRSFELYHNYSDNLHNLLLLNLQLGNFDRVDELISYIKFNKLNLNGDIKELLKSIHTLQTSIAGNDIL
jgi:lysophospholipase L1-like esterase